MDKRANALEELQALFKSNPAPFLVGGAGALAAGGLTMLPKRRKDESRLSRLGRILSNAALVGGALGGGTALLQQGVKGFKTVLPKEDVSAPERAGNFLTDPSVYAGGAAVATPLAFYRNQHKQDQGILKEMLSEITGNKKVEPGSYASAGMRNNPGMHADKAMFEKIRGEAGSKLYEDYLKSKEYAKVQELGGTPKTLAQITGEVPMGSVMDRMVEAGADPNATGLRRFAQKHLARVTGRSTGKMLARGGIYGGLIAAPYALAPALEQVFKKPDPSIYE